MENLDQEAVRVRDTLERLAPRGCEWTARLVRQRDQSLSVRRGTVEPPRTDDDQGVMVSVAAAGGVGFAATADLSDRGLEWAFGAAANWAARNAAFALDGLLPQPGNGVYESPVEVAWERESLAAKVARLREIDEVLGAGDDIVDRGASLWRTRMETTVIGSAGGCTSQRFDYLVPMLSVSASRDGDTQTRTFSGHAKVRQGGLEVLAELGFWEAAARLREEARQLVAAANCPSERSAVVLAPDQMILQIHESIGHPLELDRILGDERNYAGTSFVTPEMFGSYRYGSELLNVSFDPGVRGEFGSYAYDDDGQPAVATPIIRNGVLLNGLGGARSQRRAEIGGVANARSPSWNRPTIDRMANLNLEPGESSLDALIGGVERGVYMETNRSWSIDDARNKFQFGCELGRVIRDGELGEVVKNPGYRGVSATFWRSLDGVGDRGTFEVLGTPFCGKGEPNQVIRVGHASPACRFRDVDVFGGE